MDKKHLPPRLRRRSLLLLALLLAPLLWPLQGVVQRHYSEQLAEQNRQTLDLYVANLLGTLRRFEVLPAIFGQLPVLRAPLLAPEEAARRDQANRLLAGLQRQTGADVIYLMAPDGRTLASSNWAAEDSFIERQLRLPPVLPRSHAGPPGTLFRTGQHLGQARLLLRGGHP